MQSIFAQVFALLLCAVILVWSFKRIGLPPILAYLLTGVIAGSHGIGWMSDSQEIHFMAELGIVFLLFSLGLEFSVPKLMAMRNVVFGLGSLQVIVTTIIGMLVLRFMQCEWLGAFVIASLIALSSTAVVVKLLKELGMLNTRHGQLGIGMLLFQDIAVVPLLIAFPLISSASNSELASALLFAFAKGAVVCLVLWAVGKWLLPRIFNEIALVRTDELFVLSTLVVALCAGSLTYAFGLSMALGAFLAGMMLGESQYRHQLEAEIRPFRDILMGLFFVTVGMQLNIPYVLDQFIYIVAALAAVLVIKVLIIVGVAQLMGERKKDAWGAGILIWQMGEFGFVLLALASKHQLLDQNAVSFLITLGVLSMALTPYLISKTAHILNILGIEKDWQPEAPSGYNAADLRNHVVIFGYARVGQTIARFLRPEAIPYIAVERNPQIVQDAQIAGEPVLFGHAAQKTLLKSANIDKARLVIITFDDFEQTQVVVDAIRRRTHEVKILVRMKDDSYMEQLKAMGVAEVVPETLEASLMLVSHVLYMSGVPMRRIFRRVSKERENRYPYLHGFFAGDSSDLHEVTGERLEYLHAIALPDHAFAVNKSIAELELKVKRVDITALRRDGEEIAQPDEQTILRVNDVLLLKGKPRRVERAEQFLLDGLP
ncbi:potassium transporter [Pseudoalteromonas sp. HM-SA03]|uniref:monovalent cation:proton antiporter-2 (CPA2) family protein n=1 Tax=Pseudoalteromonas sp. HM-SA03 TaxID=2029678 RepID=UPI000BADEC30|nr:monovalent cation:proton antiporter-2 (CPA2) family protein [Pseudoalteromonas sp. HM-SA03]PAY02235.1 potassium transporter [Pseudoalteromonas sp. HM-SA03]